jgi:hypothetical protein
MIGTTILLGFRGSSGSSLEQAPAKSKISPMQKIKLVRFMPDKGFPAESPEPHLVTLGKNRQPALPIRPARFRNHGMEMGDPGEGPLPYVPY